MENKTCGECKLNGVDCRCEANEKACEEFEPKPITNGNKIIAGGMRAIAEFQQQNTCDNCIYFDDGNPFRVGCGRPHDKTCTDGIEAWLNAPAESEG